MTLTANEATFDYYYLRTEYALDFRKHHSYDCERVKTGNQDSLYFVGRQHYELKLPPPEALLSGPQLEDPINQ
jgi:hypothetical protein